MAEYICVGGDMAARGPDRTFAGSGGIFLTYSPKREIWRFDGRFGNDRASSLRTV
jgi:hypothetical protein